MKRRDAAAAAAGALVLFLVYALTLAPDVTFWDAGEFIAAAHSLGVPHPPGTPLFILLVNVWAKLWFFLPYPVATNLFSAAATALAAGISARLVQRATSNAYMAFAAAITAGGMSSVWLNATETEVYAASLTLGVLTIWAGERAGRYQGERWTILTAYLIALAVPLHLSALVAAPVAILLAALSSEGIRWRRVLALGGTFLFSLGVGRMTWWLCAAGAALMLSALGPSPRQPDRIVERMRLPVAALALALLATSALAFLILRARFDPAINQGNPGTWQALADVVARRQYAVSPMWPRMAPPWIQLGNLAQYADWQIALSTGPTVLPSIPRTLATLLFLWLGYQGAVVHRKADRRTWIALLALLLCGALGVLVYLNLHAGPSIGYGILPSNVTREARERDYFFVFAFWTWGLWAGVGAISVAQRWSRPAWSGALIALLPLVLNWRAVTRRGEPEQSLPRHLAEALLESTPRNGVLFVMGDNDSYPLWYAQGVRGVRPDVAVVTVPLLPTRWYRSEIARRHALLDDSEVERFESKLAASAAIAKVARRLGRPVAAATTVTAREREALGKSWRAGAPVYVEGPAGIDSVAAKRWAEWVERRIPERDTRAAIDPVNIYFRRMLDCPRQLSIAARTGDLSRLDSACNYR